MKKLLSIALVLAVLVTLTGSVGATDLPQSAGRHIVLNPRAIVIIPGIGGTTLENEDYDDV